MMRNLQEVCMSFRRLVAAAVLLVSSTAYGDAPGVYALTGATVHPVSGPDVSNGVVVIRNGLIEAAGANATVPADATVIDLKGMHVYPGLIDAQTSLGFASPAPRRGPGGGGGGGAAAAARAERPAEPTADSLAIRNANISDDDAEARRAIGVTTVLIAPASGIFNGQSALVNLGSGPIESRVIKSPAALQISFNPRPTWTYPDSLMGVVSYIRQTFFDAQQHVAATEIYGRSPAGYERPRESPALDALRPVLRRDLPVVFVADSDTMMRRAMAIAKEMNVRYVLSGARGGYELAGELKNVPVLVSVRWPTAPTDKEDREDQPLRVIRERQLQPTTPSVLAKNGVQFALVSGAGKAGDFIPGIRKAIESGLSADDALRATTIAPARIFGVDRQLGTLERGKIANVIVSDKPLFEKEAKVRRVFVDGREIRLPADDRKRGDDAPSTSPIDGTWALTVRAPEGSIAIQVTLHAEDGKVSGTFAGDRGSGDLRSGTFDGTAIDFAISANAQNDAEASDWVFRGTVTGNTMTGTVATTIGNFEFSGSRSK
ncbi:MAG TPA: amidohydrolase family protein [Thermoanaerobaculia bacterium]|jgi:imidazolonepropionase-like amidohydrolase|nr:amidohydrolase family protein [Thermoanaerobaculia bacterium]